MNAEAHTRKILTEQEYVDIEMYRLEAQKHTKSLEAALLDRTDSYVSPRHDGLIVALAISSVTVIAVSYLQGWI